MNHLQMNFVIPFAILFGVFTVCPIFSSAQLNVIDPWVDAVVQFETGDNSRGTPENVIGAPGSGDPAVNGEFALDGGYIIVDMGFGEEIEDSRGNDFRINESGNNEDFQVWISNQSDSGWVDLGVVNGVSTFDLKETGLNKARYIRIEDKGHTSDGADIESVEALYYPNDPWADSVVSFELNPEWANQSDPTQSDPDASLGPIDDDFVSLPFSSIIVRFIDNTVINGEGDDLFIAEFGLGGESALISISSDGQNWTELGIADNNTTTSFDLASVNFTTPAVFVRIEGLDAGGGSPGFDLDAVYALPNSIGAAPQPTDDPTDGSNLVEIIDPGFTIVDAVTLTGMRPLYPDGFKPLFSEEGDVFLTATDSLAPSSPYAKIIRQRQGDNFTSVLRIKDPLPGKQILSMWAGSMDQFVLLIGPDRITDDGGSFYYLVRIKGPFHLTNIRNSFLY